MALPSFTTTPNIPMQSDTLQSTGKDTSLPDLMGSMAAETVELEAKEKQLLGQKKEREAAASAAASKAKQAAVEGRVREVRQEYEPKLAQTFPDFTPSKESAPQLSALGGILMIMGTMTGRKGLMGATGAMNSMAGMIQGYQQGRKDVYAREKQQFETNFKNWQQNRAVIKEAFDRAIKYAPYDIQTATNRLTTDLKRAGADVLATTVQRSGIGPAKATFDTANQNADQQLKEIQSRLLQLKTQQASIAAQGKAREEGQKLSVQLGITPPPPSGKFVKVADPNDPNKTIEIPESEQMKAFREGKPYSTAPSTVRTTDKFVKVGDPNDPTKTIQIPESEQMRAFREGKPYPVAPSEQRQGQQKPDVKLKEFIVTNPDGTTTTKIMTDTQAFDERQKGVDILPKPKEQSRSGYVQSFEDMVAIAINEAGLSIRNLENTPLATTGIFQGRNTKGLFDAPIGALANKLTTEETQRYNNITTGLGANFAKVLMGGRVVPVSTQNYYNDRFSIRDGDRPFTVLTKLADIRQVFERAIEVKKLSKNTSPEMKELLSNVEEEIKKSIPFTVEDVNRVAAEVAQSKGKSVKTFKNFMTEQMGDRGSSSGASGAPPAELLTEGEETTFKNGQTWTLQNGKPVRVK